jgi:hypothetical protein
MSWAARRRFLYISGIFVFFLITIGGPIAYKILKIPPTCFDDIQNQGETMIDRGGPCVLLDSRTLLPSATLWARSFRVRDGSYNATVYIENPNNNAGVESMAYHLGLYDSENVLVAERDGMTPIMPGTITPVFESGIDTGYRIVARTRFTLEGVALWKNVISDTRFIRLNNIQLVVNETSARATATVRNEGVVAVHDVAFVAVVFDAAGTALATSQTLVRSIESGASQDIVFTWPSAFLTATRVDVLPIVAPSPSLPTS